MTQETVQHLDEEEVKRQLETIANNRDKNERLSWKRKLTKLESRIKDLKIVEDKILDIVIKEKQPIFDEIQTLRLVMIKECVHPKEYLLHKGSYIECKFCNSNIKLIK